MNKENIEMKSTNTETVNTETTGTDKMSNHTIKSVLMSGHKIELVICLVIMVLMLLWVWSIVEPVINYGLEPEESKEYAIQMADMSNLSTTVNTVEDKDAFVINTNNLEYALTRFVDINELDNFFRGDMKQVDQAHFALYTEVSYQDDIRSLKVMNYDNGQVSMYYYADSTRGNDPRLRVTVNNNNEVTELDLKSFRDMRLDALDSDLKIDNLNLKSSLQDVLDTYGLPTSTSWRRVESKSNHEVIYNWYFEKLNYDLNITFEVVATYKGDAILKMKEYSVEPATAKENI